MKIVILCGGLGSRLREETEFRPKPLLEIGNRPILWHIMKTYAHYGLRDFVLCLGYKGNMIKEYFLNYDAMTNDFTICLGRKQEIKFHNAHDEGNFHVSLADTGVETMTGGRVKRVQKYIGRSTFMLTYGDGVADVDFNKLLTFHQEHGKLATVTTVQPASQFGIVTIGEGNAIASFSEKPRMDGRISGGFFVFEPEVFDYLEGDTCVLEREPLERLAREGQLMAYPHDGFFQSMDTYRDYQHLNRLWASGEAPWKVWKK